MPSQRKVFECAQDIYGLAGELHIQERKVLDFSTPVNPLRVSKKVKAEIRKHLKYLHNHPDTEARRLRKRLAQYHDLDQEMILCGNGRVELLYLILRTLRPKTILLPEPPVTEYERAAHIVGPASEIKRYALLEENDFNVSPEILLENMEERNATFKSTSSDSHLDFPAQLVIVSNPNNLTGKILSAPALKKIAEAAKSKQCLVIVDEAFINFSPDGSAIGALHDNPCLVVLRSFSYFYALAGLRIGYGIFPAQLAKELKRQKEPFTVNNLAQRAAFAALRDSAYIRETSRVLDQEKKFLERNFHKVGVRYFESDVNFYLLELPDAQEICYRFQKKGFLVTNCFLSDTSQSFIRIPVKSHRENVIFVKMLSLLLHGSS